MKKRILSVMLVLCMVIGMMPAAFAEDDTSGSVDVTTFAELKTALEAAAAADSGDTTINILNNITLAEGENWSAVNIDGYHGADTITIHGNGHTISGLDAPLFSGGFAGGSGLVVDQLTLDSVTINDSASSTGVGAFIGSVDSMDVVSLTDCHLTNSTITCTGGPRVGGLIGWTSGYNNQNDGPVNTQITIDNCSVENCAITSNGSVGGLIGHAGANPATYHTIRNCTVTGNTLTSTDDGGWRVGIVVGTANVGELAMDGITESGNTLAQTDKEAPANTLYGRFVPGDTGTLTIDGTPVFGSDIVAQNGSSGYKTLSAAVDAAATGDTITLLTDISEDVTIPEGKDVTLDLGGHTMTVPSDCGIEVLGLLTVTDSGENGTITCTDTPIRVNGSGAKFTLESGAVISTDDYGIYAKDNGTAVVNGGSISSKDAALSGNNTTGDMNFEVHGGTITAAQGPAIYMPGQVNLTITNGTLNGGISLRMGQVDISGGTINSITKNIDSPSEYYGYSGNAWLPDALYVFGGTYTSENATYGNSLNLNITGGTFTCLNDQGSAIAIYDLGKVAQEENISISGDAKLTSISDTRKSYQVLSLDDISVTDSAYGANSGKVSTTITGGTFTTDPSDYLEDDYQAVQGDDGYTVSMKDTVATIGERKYTSLAKAIAAAQDDDTVTLVADTTEDISISGTKNLTLDLGGKTLTNTGIGKATLFVGSNAVVSVQNGSIVGGASYYNIQCGTEADPTGSIELTDVTATAGNDGSSMIDNWGILTIHSGTYTGGMNTVKSEPTGTLTINGGDFTCSYAASYSYNGVVLSYGTATVTDGTFTHTATTPNWAYPCAFMTAKDKDTDPTPHTTITGGTFTVKHSRGKSVWGYGKANSSNFEISGGHYSSAPSTSAVAEGYGVTDKVDGYYGIDPANAITIEPLTNGKITTTSPAPEGKKVTLTIKPTTGYVLDTISVKTASDTEVQVRGNSSSKTFTMPAEAVTVSATFKKADYKITIKATNGTVTAPATAQYGETVSLAVTPDPGYELSTISVKKSTTKVTLNEDSTFTMPAGNVTVSATFKKAAAPSPEPSVSTTTTVSTDVSTDIPSADKKAIEAVLDDASVEGIEKAADTGDILDAAGVTEADTKAKKVEIEITTKVIAEGADLSAGTLTFSAAPVATITIDGKKVSKDVPVTNDMLNGKNITIKLPLPKGFVPEEIIHISNDGLRQHYTAQDFKVETAENGGQVAVLKITHFSQFILNAKTHVHTWDQGTVITEPTATTDGTMHYVCTVCGDEKDEVIPAVPATQLTLDPPSVRLAVGKTQALTLTVVPENATGTVVWSSSNSAVATVDETGNVTAVAAGTTAITAVLGTQTAVATISVVCGTDTCQYYTDVDAGAWYHPAVDFVTEHKLMQGVDAKARTFVPGHELTRAQLAQVLYNMENPGDTASEKSFKDVKQGAWYYNAVIWAADNGIVKGYEDGCFYPNRPITREQMVTMLYRYMQFKGLRVDASSEDWKSFTDYANVHAWAQDAMAWAVHNGVVNGIQNNQLAPTHTAQRSQVAKIIMEITMLYDLA